MYSILKSGFTFIFPKKALFRPEPFLRKCYAITKKGNNHLCTICGFKASRFEHLYNMDLLCPNCGSLARDRRLWKLISEKHLKEGIVVLDFSPSRSLFRNWKKIKNINYTSSDLSGDFISDVNSDITQIAKANETFDLIICYHILEHVIEDEKASERVKRPFECLLFNNTIIKKECFDEIKFDTEITNYGHDDTQLSYQLKSKEIKIKHINNQIQHGDIDTNAFFLEKTKISLENLRLLDQNQLIHKNYNKMLSVVSKLHSFKITYFLSAFHTVFGKTLEYNLKGTNPSLFVFNILRLTYFSKLYVK
jgi:hypothetical protein